MLTRSSCCARSWFSISSQIQLCARLPPFIQNPLEYCNHLWGRALSSPLSLPVRVQQEAFRLINNRFVTLNLQSLAHLRAVAAPPLSYGYYFDFSSSERFSSTHSWHLSSFLYSCGKFSALEVELPYSSFLLFSGLQRSETLFFFRFLCMDAKLTETTRVSPHVSFDYRVHAF